MTDDRADLLLLRAAPCRKARALSQCRRAAARSQYLHFCTGKASKLSTCRPKSLAVATLPRRSASCATESSCKQQRFSLISLQQRFSLFSDPLPAPQSRPAASSGGLV